VSPLNVCCCLNGSVINIHTYIHMDVHLYTQEHKYICTYNYLLKRIKGVSFKHVLLFEWFGHPHYIYTYIYTYIHFYTNIHKDTNIFTHIITCCNESKVSPLNMCCCLNGFVIHISKSSVELLPLKAPIYMYTYMFICLYIYACINRNTRIYTCIYVIYKYKCIYILWFCHKYI
jgi:hypothetical protein